MYTSWSQACIASIILDQHSEQFCQLDAVIPPEFMALCHHNQHTFATASQLAISHIQGKHDAIPRAAKCQFPVTCQHARSLMMHACIFISACTLSAERLILLARSEVRRAARSMVLHQTPLLLSRTSSCRFLSCKAPGRHTRHLKRARAV